jgi:transcriptional regulator with XRE-family HTH domain
VEALAAMASDHDRALGAAIRELRQHAGLTQEGLAYAAGLTFGTIARTELAQATPRWASIRAIVEALGVSWRELGDAIDAHEAQPYSR